LEIMGAAPEDELVAAIVRAVNPESATTD